MDESHVISVGDSIDDRLPGPDVRDLEDDVHEDDELDDEILDQAASMLATQQLEEPNENEAAVGVAANITTAQPLAPLWPDTQEGFLKAFKSVVYADEEEGFKNLWQHLKTEFARQIRQFALSRPFFPLHFANFFFQH